MPYENIPGVGATYLDGSLRIVRASAQPKVLVLGSAESGVPYSIFQINAVSDAENEFGSSSEMFQRAHEALRQGSDNIAVMRIGGKKGKVVITDSAGGTLTIVPELRDDAATSRYALLMEVTDDDIQRILVYDLESETYIYDSEEIKVLDTGLVDVIDGGLTLCSTPAGWLTDPNTASALDDLELSDFTSATLVNFSASAGASIEVTLGDDGLAMSYVERYAALEEGYQFMDYRDADIVVPCEVFVDVPNIADGASISFADGVPLVGSANDGLGYLWKFLYRGKPYIFFSDSSSLFTAGPATYAFEPGDEKFRVTALATGPSGELITVEIENDDAAVKVDGYWPVTVVTTGEHTHVITVTCPVATATVNDIVDAINNDATADDLVVAVTLAGGASPYGEEATGTLALASAHFLSHEDLTGDEIPTAVWDRFAEGENAELREVNFAHQLAYACYRASTTWQTMLGLISALEPTGYTRATIAEWIGEEPTYSYFGEDLAVGSVADNGEGVLGIKFHAGKYGYRSHLVPGDDTGDAGYAYGGYILTQGAALPTTEPYGVNSDDEALDAKGEPIDLGKHILVTYDWPILSNGYNGGTQYRGPLTGSLAGKLAITPENIEPIGSGGLLVGLRRPPRMRFPLVDSLAKLRFVGTRLEEGVGYIIVSANTAAHPNSDYIRLTTIRCVNRGLSGIRDLARPYLGKEFSATRLASLQQAIDGFLKGEKEAGFNQGAIASLSYTRADRILGRLTIRLKMIPPFSIRAIMVETTLAAEEADLVNI